MIENTIISPQSQGNVPEVGSEFRIYKERHSTLFQKRPTKGDLRGATGSSPHSGDFEARCNGPVD